MGMQLIETIEVGAGGAASIEFTSIPQDGVDLVLKVSGRCTTSSSSGTPIKLALNSDTTNGNYTGVFIIGEGSGTPPSYSLSNREVADVVNSTQTSNTFSSNDIYFSNYAGSSNKSFSVDSVTENNDTVHRARIVAGLWANTSAITGLALTLGSGDFAQYSTASLYKITAD